MTEALYLVAGAIGGIMLGAAVVLRVSVAHIAYLREARLDAETALSKEQQAHKATRSTLDAITGKASRNG